MPHKLAARACETPLAPTAESLGASFATRISRRLASRHEDNRRQHRPEVLKKPGLPETDLIKVDVTKQAVQGRRASSK